MTLQGYLLHCYRLDRLARAGKTAARILLDFRLPQGPPSCSFRRSATLTTLVDAVLLSFSQLLKSGDDNRNFLAKKFPLESGRRSAREDRE